MDSKKRRVNTFSENLKKQYPFIIKMKEEDVKCTICNAQFDIRSRGRSAIEDHCKTVKHKTALDSASSSSKITAFAKHTKFDHDERTLAIEEGTFAFHTIHHNHSFRSMDCTSKLIKKFHNTRFSCARTKCEAIVVSVFKKFTENILKEKLSKVRFVSILCDASNHNETKMYPILVRYFDIDEGISTKILQMRSIEGETSDILSEYVVASIIEANIGKKLLALSADNTNTNFGGLKRRGVNNLHKKLMDKLGKNIIGIGCNAHILSNAINIATSNLCINVEIIIPQIYLFFKRFTVRVTELENFCQEANIEYKKILGYSKVRWLSVIPSIERIIQMFEPLKSYFLSIDKCPKILKEFWENDMAELILYFVHSQATIFHVTVQKIEKDNVSAAQVSITLNELKQQIRSRQEQSFLPIIVMNKLKIAEESNPQIRNKFMKEVKIFYDCCIDYIDEWTEHFNNLIIFQWTILDNVINWDDVVETIKFLNDSFKIEINDNELFEEIRRLNIYCTEEIRRKWNQEEIDPGNRWVQVFAHFKQNHIDYKNLNLLVEAALCLPGTNACVERVFSLINDFWTEDKSRMQMSTVASVLTVKYNLRDYNCSSFAELLEKEETLLKEIHSVEKYSTSKH